MNKAISVAAILALSAASTEFADHELINLHLEQPRLHRPTFSPVVRDVAHDDEQMVRLSPEILKPHYRTFTPLVADDNDDELLIRLDPELTRPRTRFPLPIMAVDDNDDEFAYVNALRADDNDDEFYVDEQGDNELGFFKSLGNGLKKAGGFVLQNPKILTTAAKFLDDDEFYADQQADDEFLIRLDPALTRPHTRIPLPIMAADDNDDEFAYVSALRADDNDDEYFVAPGLVADDEFYVDDEFFADQQADDELLIRLDPALTRPHTRIPFPIMAVDDDEFFVDEQVDDELFAHDAAFIKKAQREVRASNEALKRANIEKKPATQDSLSSLGGLLKEGKKVQLPKRPQPVKTQEVQDNMNFLEDFQDNNLSIKDKLKGAANWIGDHPQVITEAAKTYKTLKGKH